MHVNINFKSVLFLLFLFIYFFKPPDTEPKKIRGKKIFVLDNLKVLKRWKGTGHRYFTKSITSHPLRQKFLKRSINIVKFPEILESWQTLCLLSSYFLDGRTFEWRPRPPLCLTLHYCPWTNWTRRDGLFISSLSHPVLFLLKAQSSPMRLCMLLSVEWELKTFRNFCQKVG